MQENKQEKSLIKQNILLYLAKKGVTPYEFYKVSGVTRGVLSQNNGISEDNLTRFLAYAQDVNPTWLITGEGDMLTTGVQSSKSSECQTTIDDTTITNKSDNYQGIIDSILQVSVKKDDIIRQQAEEIGRLKQRIQDLTHRLEKSAEAANTNHTANAG